VNRVNSRNDCHDDGTINIVVPIFLLLLPLSHSPAPLLRFPLEFRGEVNREETRVMGLSWYEDRMIVA